MNFLNEAPYQQNISYHIQGKVDFIWSLVNASIGTACGDLCCVHKIFKQLQAHLCTLHTSKTLSYFPSSSPALPRDQLHICVNGFGAPDASPSATLLPSDVLQTAVSSTGCSTPPPLPPPPPPPAQDSPPLLLLLDAEVLQKSRGRGVRKQ